MRERAERLEVPAPVALVIDIPGLGDHRFRLMDPVRLLRHCESAAAAGDSAHAQAAVSAAAVGWFWAHPEFELDSAWDEDPSVYGERVSAELFGEGWTLIQIVGTGAALMRAAQEAMPSPDEVSALAGFTVRRASQNSRP